MRGRSYSYSPSPPRSYARRGRSPRPRGRGRDPSTSLLVRNLRHDCRVEDLRRPFGQFGPLKDVICPGIITRVLLKRMLVFKKRVAGENGREIEFEVVHWEDIDVLKNLKSSLNSEVFREPRGFGFVQYVDPADAAEAKYQMDGQILLGRELTVVFAEENRKKPADMRARERVSGRARGNRRSPRTSRSPPPRSRSRSRSLSYYSPSPRRKHYSTSVSPRAEYERGLSYSLSPPYNGSRSRSLEEDYARRTHRERSASFSH